MGGLKSTSQRPRLDSHYKWFCASDRREAFPSSVTKDIFLLIHIQKVYRWCNKAPKKHHTFPADVLPNASEALFIFISSILLEFKVINWVTIPFFTDMP